MKNKLFLIGVFLFLTGTIIIAGTQVKITGYSVEDSSLKKGSFLGLVFFIAGIGLMLSQRYGMSDIGQKVTLTDPFKEDIARQPLKRVEAALTKLIDGKGRREPLRKRTPDGKLMFSLRAGGGERVIYTIGKDGKPTVLRYLPDHDYDCLHGHYR
jgi:hypothetical protein